MMEQTLLGILIFLCIGILFFLLIILQAIKRTNSSGVGQKLIELKKEFEAQQRQLRQEVNTTTQNSVKLLADVLSDNQQNTSKTQEQKLDLMDKHLLEKQETLQTTITSLLSHMEERFQTFSIENEQKLNQIRQTMERRLLLIQEDNSKKLDEMRKIVDEKLQQTLEERMTRSFQLVNDRLEQVYKGLGEMQTLASGVGDLKKVLSNVKTRGILGEIQLGAILEEILAPEQYETNVATKKGSKNVVEYAIKLPTENDRFIYLPIDAKFPGDTYQALQQAYDTGTQDDIKAAAKALISRIKSEAKDIHDKYIDPPNTTEFAILFLPFEGLYAEAVNRGLVEILQREYKVNLAGPSTMAALLNSLQMGFRTFAIQKRSSEVWDVLGAVKMEFDKFGTVLLATQQRLEQANDELDKLVGVRTRQIQRKLKSVASFTITEQKANALFNQEEEDE